MNNATVFYAGMAVMTIPITHSMLIEFCADFDQERFGLINADGNVIAFTNEQVSAWREYKKTYAEELNLQTEFLKTHTEDELEEFCESTHDLPLPEQFPASIKLLKAKLNPASKKKAKSDFLVTWEGENGYRGEKNFKSVSIASAKKFIDRNINYQHATLRDDAGFLIAEKFDGGRWLEI